jgi:hypothetical protein
MRFLSLIIFFLAVHSYSFGACKRDVIIVLDNSGSVSSFDEWPDMEVSVKAIIDEVLLDPNSRVAVVHYATEGGWADVADSKIWIESDFTTDAALAKSFIRRYNANDFLSETFSIIGDALDESLMLVLQVLRQHSTWLLVLLWVFLYLQMPQEMDGVRLEPVV